MTQRTRKKREVPAVSDLKAKLNTGWLSTKRSIAYYASIYKSIEGSPETLIDRNLSEAARCACLSRGAFCRMFSKASGGVSYHAFRRQGCLLLALQQMESSDLPITEIAFRTGFESLWGFERAFQAWFGLSPRRYRHFIRCGHLIDGIGF